ncbi:Carbohydrate esterase family protein [Salix suchowensis]|nr:Carbohydrate esterase family protein [Salix suchowensis]
MEVLDELPCMVISVRLVNLIPQHHTVSQALPCDTCLTDGPSFLTTMSPDNKALPVYTPPLDHPKTTVCKISTSVGHVIALGTGSLAFSLQHMDHRAGQNAGEAPLRAKEILDQCRSLELEPGPPPDFHLRKASDRFVPNTKPVLIKNATIWTGETSGYETLRELGYAWVRVTDKQLPPLFKFPSRIVDLHSHLGVLSSPALRGSSDGNSRKGLVQPWLRSLDGLNTHDEAYQLSISGGVTTANVLPGSANSIGGQAFTIKLRPTKERSTSSMLLEPPFTLNGTEFDPSVPPRWRQMNYETARKIKVSQDEFCAKAQAGLWNEIGDFPEDLQWEALVDVLRGRVKASDYGRVSLPPKQLTEYTTCPDLLKKTYGHPPAVAIFATNGRYKREAYRGSEFAARILADNGLNVVMKTTHKLWRSPFLPVSPETPNFDKEAADAIKYEGLPPLVPSKAKSNVVIFSNVSSLFIKSSGTIKQVFGTSAFGERGVAVVKAANSSAAELPAVARRVSRPLVRVTTQPGLLTFGSPLGLREIAGEATTSDGVVGDPWVPGFLLLLVAKVRSLELLMVFNSPLEMHCKFDRRCFSFVVWLLVWSRVAFSVGASHALESGAIQKPVTALHVAITRASSVSVSTQIAALRRLLFGKAHGELGERAKAVVSVSKRACS